MKQIALTVIFSLALFMSVFAQLDDNYYLSFDDQYSMEHLYIDTISNPNNIWQVGKPQKMSFSVANSQPNVIVTDTINSYPINDTSTFFLVNVASGDGYTWPHTVVLSGYYFVNSDTITDYGKIEFSPDNGTTWIDLLNDTVIIDTAYNLTWYWPDYDKPVLSGNSNQWKPFYVHLATLGHFYGVEQGDTVLFKFTFISDGIQTNKDGLMFDDIISEDWAEEIETEKQIALRSTCYPNPVKHNLTIRYNCSDESSCNIIILDVAGMILFKRDFISEDSVELNVDFLKSGCYFYKITNSKSKILSAGKFIKE